MVEDEDSQNQDRDQKARQHPRAPMALKVEYTQLNRFFSDYTSNISKGGTFIRSDRPLKVGTEFIFHLHVPARESPIELSGRVAWVNSQGRKEVPEIDELGMGILFIYEGADEKAKLEREVEELMVESMGVEMYRGLVESLKKDGS